MVLSGFFGGCNALFGIEKPNEIVGASGEAGTGDTSSSGGSANGGAGGAIGGRMGTTGGTAGKGSGSSGGTSGGSAGNAGDGGSGGSSNGGSTNGGSSNGGSDNGGSSNGGSDNGGSSGAGASNGGSTNAGTGGGAGSGGSTGGGAGTGGTGAGMGGGAGTGSAGMPPADPCDLGLEGPKMVLIPAGSGPIGTTDTEIENAQPEITVTFDDYCIDTTEVTLGHYKACVTDGGCNTPDTSHSYCNWSTTKDAYPVNCIDHDRAEDYCVWALKRLPTEKEWEHAARGDSPGRKYPWGNSAPSQTFVNYKHSTGSDGTTPVGMFPDGATPEGVFDMAGNVWEWTDTLFCDGYGPTPTCDPVNYAPHGGSYGSAYDMHVNPSWHDNSNTPDARFGFRCVHGAGEM